MSEKSKIILSIGVLLGTIIIGALLYFPIDSKMPFIAFIMIAPSLAIAVTSYIEEKKIDIVSSMTTIIGFLYFLLALPTKGIIANISQENSLYIVMIVSFLFLGFNLYYLFTKSED